MSKPIKMNDKFKKKKPSAADELLSNSTTDESNDMPPKRGAKVKPINEKHVKMMITLNPKLRDLIVKYAKKNFLSNSAFISSVMIDYINNHQDI